MNERTPSRPAPQTRRTRLRRLLLSSVVTAMVILALLVFGRDPAGRCCRFMARRAMDHYTFSQALAWLNRAEWIDPHDGRTVLMRGRCYRQMGQWRAQDESLAEAERYGIPASDVNREAELAQIQQGELAEGGEARFQALIAAGMSPHDVAAAFIQGHIVRADAQQAEARLQAWESTFPGHPHVLYMRGVLLADAGDGEGSRQALNEALAAEPGHELAQLALARHAETDKLLPLALERYQRLAERYSDMAIVPDILVGLARVLRQLGQHAQARAVLTQLPVSTPPLSAVECEWGQLELDAGNYASAQSHFDRVSARDMTELEPLVGASLTLHFLGQTVRADRVLLGITFETTSHSLILDLQNRLAVNPANRRAKADLQDLTRALTSRMQEGNPYQWALVGTTRRAADELPGMPLYEEQCSACHSPDGNGRGRAARNLFPLPRDLHAEPMRLVSSENGIPTRDDIRRAIRDGIPGTSMVALSQLTDGQLDQVTDVVLHMRRQGIGEQYVALLQDTGEVVDPEDVDDVIRTRTTPGETLVAPPTEPADEAAIAAGNELYVQHACPSCHGLTGRGDDLIPLFDTRGQPAYPRDLVYDRFKGGNDAASIYRRVRLGMPGSPHPASPVLTEPQLIDLVRYCVSLGRTPKNNWSNYQRALQASTRPAIEFRTDP